MLFVVLLLHFAQRSAAITFVWNIRRKNWAIIAFSHDSVLVFNFPFDACTKFIILFLCAFVFEAGEASDAMQLRRHKAKKCPLRFSLWRADARNEKKNKLFCCQNERNEKKSENHFMRWKEIGNAQARAAPKIVCVRTTIKKSQEKNDFVFFRAWTKPKNLNQNR